MFLKGEILIQYIPFSVGADKLMSISYKYNSINLDDYLELRNHVNKTPVTREIADEIMKNSICTVTAFDEESKTVGFGRLVGDGVVICYIQDLMVHTGCRYRNIGKGVLEQLESYVKSITRPGVTMMLALMSTPMAEQFYEKHGFTKRPTENYGSGFFKLISGDDNE